MENMNLDNINFLWDAREAIAKLNEAKAVADEQDLQTRRLEKSLASEKKAVQDSIDMTIRKRKAEIADSYDTQIEQTQAQLKKARSRREKAKEQGVKERIEQETAGIKEENRKLGTEIRTLFRQNRVPGYCNSLFFYALYYTKGFREVLVFLLMLVACFLAVPAGVYFLIGSPGALFLILIYAADIFLFGGLYFMVNNQIKVRHHETLREGRQIRNSIAANQHKVKAIRNSIRKDKNETMYGLEKHDQEIGKLEDEKAEIAAQKQTALTNFENSGKVLITKEITDNNKERIDQLEQETEKANQILNDFQARVKILMMKVTESFEPLLGREFLNTDKIDRLLEVLERGLAANITEAQEFVRAGKKIPVPEELQAEVVVDAVPSETADLNGGSSEE